MKKHVVIIFAAGRGKRLHPYTKNTPKCLMKVGGETLIERQVRACEEAGLKDIVVVTGYKDALVRKVLGKRAKYVKNTIFLRTQTLYSFLCSKKLGFDRPHIHIDSDNFFDVSLIKKLLESKDENVLLVDTNAKLDGESTKARVKDGKILAVGKTISGANVEITGLMKLGTPLVNALYEMSQIHHESGRYSSHVFSGLTPLLKKYPVTAKSIGKLFWIEIDFAKDLKKVRKKFD